MPTRNSLRWTSARVLFFLFVLAVPLGTASTLQAATATWDRNPEPDVVGYKLSYGLVSRNYTTIIDVGNVTSWTLTTLTPGVRYYFAAQAYNSAGMISPYSAEVFFDVPASVVPIISTLSPTSGAIGSSVTITGANFGATKGTSTVRFNGITATTTSWSATSIVATVPAGATTGLVVVTVGGLASIGVSFNVTTILSPSISTLSPASGPVATVVTITGTNFGAIKGTSTVRFNGTTAATTSWSATSIVATVPAGATTGNVVVTVGALNSNAVLFTVTTATLPAPWSAQDVGNPALAGRTTWAAGTFSVTGGGTNIWGTSDQFHFAYQTLDGNGEIVARVASLQSTTSDWAKAGVMIRDNLTGGAPYVMADVTVGAGLAFQRRLTQGGVSTSTDVPVGAAPYWVRVVRSGNTFSGYSSTNGTAWTLMGTVTVSMASRTYVGLAVTGHDAALVSTGTFTNVTVTPATPTPSISTLAPTSGAVGSPVTITGANFGATKGTSTVTFNGMTAATTSWSATSIVATVPAGATTGNVVVTVGGLASNGAAFIVTVPPPPSTPSISTLSPTSGPVATSVTIAGTNFGATKGTSTVSFNGITATTTSWSATSIVATVPAGATTGNVVVTVGGLASNGVSFTVTVAPVPPSISTLSPTSGPVATAVTITGTNFGATKGTSTVRFNGTTAATTSWSATSIIATVPAGSTTGNVVVTVGALNSNGVLFTVTTGTLPAPWSSQDVGNPALAGRTTWAAGTFSVTGGGTNIWGTSDQFHFAYQTLDGNGEIMARVASLQSTTSDWAKAGVMIRDNLTGGAPYVMADVTVGAGLAFQRRLTQGGVSTSTDVPVGATPYWVRVVRNGNTFSGYSSTNGTAWTLMGTVTVSMASRTYVGLAVTGHDPALVTTGTFTNVTVTPATAPLSMTTLAPLAAQASTTGAIGTPTEMTETSLVSTAPTSSDAMRASDFDGDRKADITAYSSVTGTWTIKKSTTNYTASLTITLGLSTDIPVPGDYDGDGKADVAVYRPSTGEWIALLSSTNYATSSTITWGLSTEIPVPGDYDGDGRTDIAVYLPTAGTWSMLLSSTNYATNVTATLGLGADIPVPGDYDGDGKTDIATYRPSTGSWSILPTSTNDATTVSVVWGGVSGDTPVPGDYDGDGKTDVAVYRPSNGTWYILQSSAGGSTSVAIAWGTETSIPVPGDYDGDGKTDIVVRESTGELLIFP